MRKIALLLPLFLSACSLYESDGRKFLENNLSTIGVKISAYVEKCDFEPVSLEDWQSIKSTEDAQVFAGGEGYQLRVLPLADMTFHCDYRLPNAKSLFEHSADAAADTVQRLKATAPKASDKGESSF